MSWCIVSHRIIRVGLTASVIVGSLLIKVLEVKPYGMLTDEDAQRDGFANLDELVGVLHDIYGEVGQDELVSIYGFEFIPTLIESTTVKESINN